MVLLLDCYIAKIATYHLCNLLAGANPSAIFA